MLAIWLLNQAHAACGPLPTGSVAFADLVSSCYVATPNVEYTLGDATCRAAGATLSPNACDAVKTAKSVEALRKNPSLKVGQLAAVAVGGVPAFKADLPTLNLSGQTLTLPPNTTDARILIFEEGKGWTPHDLTDTSKTELLDATVRATAESKDAKVLVGGRLYALTTAGGGDGSPGPMACKLDEADAKNFAIPARVQLICIDRAGGGADPDLRMSPPLDGWLPVNRAIVVKLRAPKDKIDGAKVTMDGTPGLTTPKVADYGTAVKAASGPGDEAASGPSTRTFVFAPRQPGEATLSLEYDGKTSAVAQFSFAQPIGGAVRVGVGVSTVVDASYTAVTAPGSSTPEILATSAGAVQPELVVGWAPFVEADGRIYADPKRNRLAPYLGLGIVAVNPENDTALSLLRSVYGGVEFELMRSSSLTVAGTIRRVSRLADPYDVGGPLETTTTTVPTTTSYAPGVAVIFNVSPEFLEYARSPFRTKSQ